MVFVFSNIRAIQNDLNTRQPRIDTETCYNENCISSDGLIFSLVCFVVVFSVSLSLAANGASKPMWWEKKPGRIFVSRCYIAFCHWYLPFFPSFPLVGLYSNIGSTFQPIVATAAIRLKFENGVGALLLLLLPFESSTRNAQNVLKSIQGNQKWINWNK